MLTDEQIKAMLHAAGFHNGHGPYIACGCLQAFRNLLEPFYEDAMNYRFIRDPECYPRNGYLSGQCIKAGTRLDEAVVAERKRMGKYL